MPQPIEKIDDPSTPVQAGLEGYQTSKRAELMGAGMRSQKRAGLPWKSSALSGSDYAGNAPLHRLSGGERGLLEGVDGRTVIDQILRNEPDLVFLDVQMPEIDGIEMVRLVGPDRMPAVIFVTAYDQYALKAFELAAVDYLLKPFSDDRFQQAVERAREQIRHRSFEELSEQMMGVLRSAGRVDRPKQGRSTTPETVDPEGRTHLIRERMKTSEERLPPEQFCRIHRSTIVNLDRVEALEPTDPGDIVARLTTGKRLRVSRSRRKELEKRLGL